MHVNLFDGWNVHNWERNRVHATMTNWGWGTPKMKASKPNSWWLKAQYSKWSFNDNLNVPQIPKSVFFHSFICSFKSLEQFSVCACLCVFPHRASWGLASCPPICPTMPLGQSEKSHCGAPSTTSPTMSNPRQGSSHSAHTAPEAPGQRRETNPCWNTFPQTQTPHLHLHNAMQNKSVSIEPLWKVWDESPLALKFSYCEREKKNQWGWLWRD